MAVACVAVGVQGIPMAIAGVAVDQGAAVAVSMVTTITLVAE